MQNGGWTICQCHPDQECDSDADCDPGWTCDSLVNQCKPENCTPQCSGRCCGEDGCGGTCPNTCDPESLCSRTTCVCTDADCCPGLIMHGDIHGRILQFPSTDFAEEVAYAVVPAADAFTNTNPIFVYRGIADERGNYQTDCINLAQQLIAMLLLTDDDGFDGSHGNWYPTYSVVMRIESEQDLTCVPDALVAWAMPAAVVEHLSMVPGLEDIQRDGFAVVFITDSGLEPLAGARLVRANDPNDELDGLIYPDSDFMEFDGDLTSGNGIVILSGVGGLAFISAEAPGREFSQEPIGVIESRCITQVISALE